MDIAGPTIYAFDIGGSTTRAGVFDGKNIELVTTVPTPKTIQARGRNPEDVSDVLINLFSEIAQCHPLPDALAVAVTGRLRVTENVGARRPGPLDRKDLVLSTPYVAGLANTNFMGLLEGLGWDVPIHVENGTNSALRSVTQHPTAIGVNVGWGVSAAVKRDNAIQHFNNSWSCYEMGHGLRTMFPDNLMLKCACGGVGCLEAIIGGRSLALRYGIPPERAKPTIYAQMRADVIEYLAPAIADLATSSDCDTVILGGKAIAGFSENYDFIGEIQRHIADVNPRMSNLKFEISQSPDTASMHGAALALLDNNVLGPSALTLH